jgi:hypothetical protein
MAILQSYAIHRSDEVGYCCHCGADLTIGVLLVPTPCERVLPFIPDEGYPDSNQPRKYDDGH